MTEPTVDTLTLGLIQFVLLPMWVICGSLDYVCHRLTRIEETSGFRESVYHAVMGFQGGIPLWMGIFFEINVLVLLVSFVCFVTHEWTAHKDMVMADEVREVTIWEQHLHSYLATIPFYVLTLIACRNWDQFVRTITFQWSGDLQLTWRPEPLGTTTYVWWYATLMLVVAVIPYTEELIRCWMCRNRCVPSKP